jgi:type I restriction enzyme, S subunit
VESFSLRDESNVLLDQAQEMLRETFDLPPVEDLSGEDFVPNIGVRNFSVPSTDIAGRFEARYHNPQVRAITKFLETKASLVTTVGNERVSKKVILPGRFKRVYVEAGQGVPFFGGKELLELDPSGKKYLSIKQHGKRIQDQLQLKQNTVLVTCSGTIGKVALVPKHWEGWAASQHVLRVIPASDEMAGYLYAWLASDYAFPLIQRFTYGAVVDEIDHHHLSEVAVPLPKDTSQLKKISDLVLQANEKRSSAYKLEKDALKILDEKVLFANGG